MKSFYFIFMMFGSTLLSTLLVEASRAIHHPGSLQPPVFSTQQRLMPSSSGVFWETCGASAYPFVSRHRRTSSAAGRTQITLQQGLRNSEQLPRFLPQIDPLQEVMVALQSPLLCNDIHGTLSILQSYANAKQYEILLGLARQQELLTRILAIAQEDRTQTSTGLECFELFDQAAEALSEVAPLGVKVGYQCLKYVLKGLSTIIEKSSDRLQEVKSGEWTDKSGNNVAHLAAKNYSPKLTAWCLVNCMPEVFNHKNKQGRTPYQLAEVKKSILVKEYEAAVQKKEVQAEAKAKRLATKQKKAHKKKNTNAESAATPTVEAPAPEIKVAAKYKRKIRHIEEVISLLSEVSKFNEIKEKPSAQKASLVPFPSLQMQIQSQATQLQSTPNLKRALSADKFSILEEQRAAHVETDLNTLQEQLVNLLNLILKEVEQSIGVLKNSLWLEKTLAIQTDLNEGQKLLLEMMMEQAAHSSSEQES